MTTWSGRDNTKYLSYCFGSDLVILINQLKRTTEMISYCLSVFISMSPCFVSFIIELVISLTYFFVNSIKLYQFYLVHISKERFSMVVFMLLNSFKKIHHHTYTYLKSLYKNKKHKSCKHSNLASAIHLYGAT